MSGAYFMKRFIDKRRRKSYKIQTRLKNNPSSNVIHDAKCRVCLKQADIPIYNWENTFNIAEAIRIFGGVEVHEEDEYPKYLCVTCHTFLQNAVLFRKTAHETEKALRQSCNMECDISDTTNNVDDNYKHELCLKSYHCRLCKVSFEQYNELVAHQSSKVHKSVRIQCPVCLSLLTAQLYKKHLARHQSASHLVCDICGKLYRKDNLVRHLQLHNFDLPFQCKECPYRGRFVESLKIHMRTHTGDKPFSCDKCELRFLTRSNLNRHILTHNKEKPFKCVECDRGFYTKRDMDSHFMVDHGGIRDFNCRMCGHKYGTRKALMRHELRVHKRHKMAKADYQNISKM